MSSIKWRCADVSAFSTYAARWDELVVRAGYPVFLQSPFLEPALEVFGYRDGRLLTGWDGSQLQAAAIIERVGFQRWQTYQPSQLPLGPWIARPDLPWRALTENLFAAMPPLTLTLGITRQDPLFAPRGAIQAQCDTVDYITTSWMEVSGTFESYRESLGKNLRQNLRKQRRRIEEQHGALEFAALESAQAVDGAFEDFARLEGAGWKGKENSAITLHNTQGRFYRNMLQRMAERRQAFAWRLSCGGAPIAVDFGVRDGTSLYVLKTTYDENLKAFSPGQLLHENAFEHVFGQGSIKRIEFYGETLDWHRRWTDRERGLFHINAYRSATVAALWKLLRGLRRSH